MLVFSPTFMLSVFYTYLNLYLFRFSLIKLLSQYWFIIREQIVKVNCFNLHIVCIYVQFGHLWSRQWTVAPGPMWVKSERSMHLIMSIFLIISDALQLHISINFKWKIRLIWSVFYYRMKMLHYMITGNRIKTNFVLSCYPFIYDKTVEKIHIVTWIQLLCKNLFWYYARMRL